LLTLVDHKPGIGAAWKRFSLLPQTKVLTGATLKIKVSRPFNQRGKDLDSNCAEGGIGPKAQITILKRK
jgi:hypothetical protein